MRQKFTSIKAGRDKLLELKLFAAGGLVLAALAVAAQTTVLSATGLTRSFQARDNLAEGTIVSLEEEGLVVTPANKDNLANLYGVVVPSDDLVVTDPNDDENSVLVSRGGVVDTLVSDLEGEIKSGDPVTVSTVAGIGEKAVSSGLIIGIAQADFAGGSENGRQFSVDSSEGKREISVGTIPVKVDIQNYSAAAGSQGVEGGGRNKLLKLADSVAGQTVKPYGAIIAGIILLFGIFISAFLVTSSGYASLISLGRNPLAEKKIMKSLAGVLLVVAGIFFASVGLAYLVLVIV